MSDPAVSRDDDLLETSSDNETALKEGEPGDKSFPSAKGRERKGCKSAWRKELANERQNGNEGSSLTAGCIRTGMRRSARKEQEQPK